MTEHAHSHAHSHISPARSARESGFSLLRLSAPQRFTLALIAVVLLWGGVFWALS